MQVIYALLAAILPKTNCLYKYVSAKRDSFLWSGFNDFLSEIYLTLAISFCINISSYEMVSLAVAINNVLAAFVGITLIFSPILIVYKLIKGWSISVDVLPKD